MTLGQLLLDRRLHMKLSRDQVAISVGVSEVTIWRWENNADIPRLGHLALLLDVIDAPDDLRLEAWQVVKPETPRVA